METKVEIPLLDLRKIPAEETPYPEIRKYIKNLPVEDMDLHLLMNDVKGKGTVISHILIDVFEGKEIKRALPLTEEEHEFLDLVHSLMSAFSTVDSKKTETAIENARRRWEECLKAVNGDLEKAEKLYDRL